MTTTTQIDRDQATAFDIHTEIENDRHADIIAACNRIRFLIGLLHDQGVRGEDDLLTSIYQGLADWNKSNANFTIYRGGHHVAVCSKDADGMSVRHLLISIGQE